MTEKDKLLRAKLYVDKLAQGIDPLSDTYVAETDVVRQARIVRCLTYVSEVLEREIAREEKPVRTRRSQRQPFTLSPEARERFAYSEEPIPISEIRNRLNQLLPDDSMKKITVTVLTEWLKNAGILETRIHEEKAHSFPTEEGLGFGLSQETRYGPNGPYEMTLYNMDAQQMIIDNLDGILACKAETDELRMRSWDAEQDAYVTKMYELNVPLSEIARVMKRKQSTIRSRLKMLGYL